MRRRPAPPVTDIEIRLMTVSEDLLTEARALCAQYGVTVSEAVSRQKARPIVAARHALWGYLSSMGWSYSYIGRICGVHHTTVMSALRHLK